MLLEELNDFIAELSICYCQSVGFLIKKLFFLGDNVSSVHPLVNVMNSNTLRCVFQKAPEVRVSAPVPWKQRDVQVDYSIS